MGGDVRTRVDATSSLPKTHELDSTLAFLREGYAFIGRRCERLRSDAFVARLFLRRVVCLRGRDAARFFYAEGHFERRHAIPPPVTLLLQGYGSVQMQEGAEHAMRKALFLSFYDAESLAALVAIFENELLAAAATEAPRVRLREWLERVLCRTACRWAGVPIAETEIAKLTSELAAMIDAAAQVGPRHWRALVLRARCERRVRRAIAAARAQIDEREATSVFARIAHFRRADGRPLDLRIAAIELINILRPTVAIGRFMMFSALALHEHPAWRDRLARGDDAGVEAFVQEVRRFYPFFPAIGGIARTPLEWRGVTFAKGTWVLLDLYGTNHDARTWRDPARFSPERFTGRAFDPSAPVAQGAGELAGHRCPGEAATIALTVAATRLFVTAIRYEVPPQDLSIDLARMPAEPVDGFVVEKLRRSAMRRPIAA